MIYFKLYIIGYIEHAYFNKRLSFSTIVTSCPISIIMAVLNIMSQCIDKRINITIIAPTSFLGTLIYLPHAIVLYHVCILCIFICLSIYHKFENPYRILTLANTIPWVIFLND